MSIVEMLQKHKGANNGDLFKILCKVAQTDVYSRVYLDIVSR